MKARQTHHTWRAEHLGLHVRQVLLEQYHNRDTAWKKVCNSLFSATARNNRPSTNTNRFSTQPKKINGRVLLQYFNESRINQMQSPLKVNLPINALYISYFNNWTPGNMCQLLKQINTFKCDRLKTENPSLCVSLNMQAAQLYVAEIYCLQIVPYHYTPDMTSCKIITQKFLGSHVTSSKSPTH